jgi:hypothetical protein
MCSLVSNSQDQVVGTVTSEFRKGELKSTSMLIYEDTVLKNMIACNMGPVACVTYPIFSTVWMTKILTFFVNNMYWMTISTLVFSMVWLGNRKHTQREGNGVKGECLSVSVDIIRS